MKIISTENPESEAHKAAMAVAFNTGSTITVKQNGTLPIWYLLNWENKILAKFFDNYQNA